MDWETAIWRVIPCCRDTSLIPPTSYTTPRNLARGNTLPKKLPAHRNSKKKATTFMWRFWKTFI